ncbi:RsmD family RNA methyltransferase [Enterococcus sp. AZ103]
MCDIIIHFSLFLLERMSEMRVVAGEFGGRKLKTLSGSQTRPTTDKVKGAIFNMIGPYFDGGKALDLFSGSGSLGIEAVSRGMEKAYLVEKNGKAMSIVKENVAMTKADSAFKLLKMPAKLALEQFKTDQIKFDLVLLDPPYAQQEIEEQLKYLVTEGLLSDKATIVCETDKNVELAADILNLKFRKRQVYGISAVTIYDWED